MLSPRPIETALALYHRGDLRGALATASEACKDAGESAGLCTLMGELHAVLGEPAAALNSFERAALLTPNDAGAVRRLAGAQFTAGRWQETVDSYRRALELDPHNARALNNLGQAYERLGAATEALECYRRAISTDASYAAAHSNLGNLLVDLNQFEEALQSLRQAVSLRPELVEAWVGQAKALLRLQQPHAAIGCCDRAVALNPHFADAWSTRGEALEGMGRSAEALRCCEEALALRPQLTRVWFASANLSRGMGDTAAAVAGFAKALEIDPEYHGARIAAAIARIPALPASVAESVESSRDYAVALAEVVQRWEGRQDIDASACVGAVQPFYLAYREQNLRDLLAPHGALCSDLMERWHAREIPKASFSSGARPTARRRIGIVSAQIAEHSVYNAITRGWVTRLDRSRFEVEIFHLGFTHDAFTQEAQDAADHFVAGLRTTREWSLAIKERGPDVLLFPEVGMSQSALQLAALRLAPVQAAAWGHPATSGLPTMDYYLSAELFEPDGCDGHYTERLLRLPNLGVYCEPTTRGRTHEEARPAGDHPEAGAVFVCAGTPFKYAPEHDLVLIDIARRVGACQFNFFSYRDGSLSERLMSRLQGAFDAAGLDGEKYLKLHPWLPPAEFSKFLRRADLFLDTLGFSGFNTVLHALECSLPVVSYRGQFMRGRLGSGLLERMELRQLVANTPRQFVDKVAYLMCEPQALVKIRERLQSGVRKVYRDDTAITALQDFLASAARGQYISQVS